MAKLIGIAIVIKVRTANPPKWNPELRPPDLTYRGKVSWNWLKAKTIRYSFQAKLNIIKLEATIAGIAKGMAIKRNDLKWLAPSTIAASSNSIGISINACRTIIITKGKINALWRKIIAIFVSYKLTILKM